MAASQKFSIGLLTLTFVFSGFVAIGSYNMGTQEVRKNDKDLISNIQKKYEVDEVLVEYRGNITNPTATEYQQVHVSVNGKVYAFDLEQNENTWEPTLLDPAVSGGSAKGENISAEELLK